MKIIKNIIEAFFTLLVLFMLCIKKFSNAANTAYQPAAKNVYNKRSLLWQKR